MFDVLVLAEQDLAVLPYVERRRALQSLLDGQHPCLQLVAHTTDIQVAEGWLAIAGLEGVVAKRLDRPYVPGRERDWIKVKRQRTVECAVIGITGDQASPRLVLALRHADGRLHHFAVTRPISAESAGPVAELTPEQGLRSRQSDPGGSMMQCRPGGRWSRRWYARSA